MNLIADYLHYGTAALAVGINAIGVGIGEGLTGQAALRAMNIQPSARNDISTTAILGMALIETAAILGISIAAMLLLLGSSAPRTEFSGIAEIGIAAAICVSGFVIGIMSSLPAQQACLSVARQPFFSKKILYFMIITQSVIQTPIIFGFIIAMFIRSQMDFITTYPESIRLMASGLCIGIGSIGPVIGLGLFAQQACHSVGINQNAYDKLFSFMLISQALIDTPVIFALTTSMLLAFSISATTTTMAIATIAAAACMSCGTFTTGISAGRTAAAACLRIAFDPEQAGNLARTSMIAQAFIDTNVIYAFVIATLLLFWH